MLNSINIIGRIITELKPTTTSTGGTCLKFRIACERDYCKPGEERQSDVFSVTAFNNNAKFIVNNFGQGYMVGITGKLKTYVHPTEDGKKFSSVFIEVSDVSFTGEHKDKEPTLFNNG